MPSNTRGMVVEIGDELHEEAREIEQARNAKKNGIGKNAINDDANENHYLGALGELIVADILGAEVDKRALEGGDDGVDLRTKNPNGKEVTIGVRTTKYRTGSLLMTENEGEKMRESEDKEIPDVTLLVRKLSKYKWEIAGFAETDEFLTEKNLCPLKSGGQGLNYEMTADELWSPPSSPWNSPNTVEVVDTPA